MMRLCTTGAIAGFAVLFAASSVQAQTAAGAFMNNNPAFRDPPPAQCNSTSEMQHCAAHELRLADDEMSARYWALRSQLNASARQRLLADQRQWLKSRDRDCLAKGERYQPGSMAAVVVATCWVSVTKTRANALGNWALPAKSD
jgi:uncharacterized protein YecT (DUF1311 family)